jgi:phosphopantothenoylcysteine decarboxylase/phosphopantothenate--cysteine ligase
MQTLAGKRILLIISGGIAAYKALELIRLIRKADGEVRCILTGGGARFITPLSVASLSGGQCYTDLWSLKDEAEMGHIRLSREADLIVVAPASANLIAKMAHGMADDLASTTLLAADKPVLIAPSMNVEMWAKPSVQANMEALKAYGIFQIGPGSGDMACGETGDGRMAEPEHILAAITRHLDGATIPAKTTAPAKPSIQLPTRAVNGPLKGLTALVTSGPTHEPLDPVRYIGNRSSGKQGHAIAGALASLGAQVTLVSGPVSLDDPPMTHTIHIENAADMLEACRLSLPVDIAICAAAVADWSPVNASPQKIKKQGRHPPPAIKLKENADILATLARPLTGRPRLVIGFAAETQDIVKTATAKRKAKNCDWILANDVSAGVFGADENHVHFINAASTEDWGPMSKQEIAARLAARIADHFQSVKE